MWQLQSVCNFLFSGQKSILWLPSHIKMISEQIVAKKWIKTSGHWLLMEPTCVLVFVWHKVPSRLRRQRPLSLFTQASQQGAFAFSGGNHRQSLRSCRDADPPLWLRLPTLLLPSPPELLQLSSTHLLLLDGGFDIGSRGEGKHAGILKYCSSFSGKLSLTQVEGTVWEQQLPRTHVLVDTSQDNQISMKMLCGKIWTCW